MQTVAGQHLTPVMVVTTLMVTAPTRVEAVVAEVALTTAKAKRTVVSMNAQVLT